MCLPQFSDRDAATVSVTFTVHNRDHTVIISSVYMAIEDQPPPLRMEQLTQHCMANNLPLIIASDTNSHHPSWGSGDYNHRGLILSEYIATTNLEVVNCGAESTFCSGNKRTVIDVTFANTMLYKDVHGWQVMSTDTMSDHRQIQFVIKRDRCAPSTSGWHRLRPEVKLAAQQLATWECYANLMANGLPPCWRSTIFYYSIWNRFSNVNSAACRR